MLSSARERGTNVSQHTAGGRCSCIDSNLDSLLRPFGFRVEVDNARLRLFRYLRAQVRFFGGFVTGIALDGLLVGVAELLHVLFLDGLLDFAQQCVIDRFEDASQIHLARFGGNSCWFIA